MKILFYLIFFAIGSISHFGLTQEVEVVLTSKHLDMINPIDVSQDGEWFVSGSVDNIVKMTHIPSWPRYTALKSLCSIYSVMN
jgi:WD40 repeat protein